MVDFSKLFEKFNEVEAKTVDRDYVKEGRHLVRVAGTETRETQAGREIAIFELDVISSSNPDHPKGSGVKQIFALSNEPAWRIKENMRIMKSMINAACPEVDIDEEYFRSCLTGGNKSAIADRVFMIIAKRKISKNNKAYLDFSYKVADENDKVELKTLAAAVAPVVASNNESNDADELEDVPFEI